MIGTRQLHRVLAKAADAGAKVVMVGDAQQLRSTEPGAVFRLLVFPMLAQSLLPHLGHGDHDQWISYTQQLLSSAMESWVTNAIGSSADLQTP